MKDRVVEESRKLDPDGIDSDASAIPRMLVARNTQVEAVLTVPGNVEDARFPQQLQSLQGNLLTLLNIGENQMHVCRVEPWNSVRITLVLPSSAASKLQDLATASDNPLAGLGVLTLRVGQYRAVNFQPPRPASIASSSVTTPQPPLRLEKKAKSIASGSRIRHSSPVASTSRAANPLRFPQPVAAATVRSPGHSMGINAGSNAYDVVKHLVNRIAANRGGTEVANGISAGLSESLLNHLQPNVVAPISQPIPIPTATTPVSALPAGPFPFSSMSKVALTVKALSSSTTTSTLQTTTRPNMPTPVSSSSVHKSAGSKAAAAAASKSRNIALSSPLLVNLLQAGDLAQTQISSSSLSSATSDQRAEAPKKRSRKRKQVAEEVAVSTREESLSSIILAPAPVKKASKPRKKKKLEETVNGMGSLMADMNTGQAGYLLSSSLDKKDRSIFIPGLSPDTSRGSSSSSLSSTSYITVFAMSEAGSLTTKSSPSATWSMPLSTPGAHNAGSQPHTGSPAEHISKPRGMGPRGFVGPSSSSNLIPPLPPTNGRKPKIVPLVVHQLSQTAPQPPSSVSMVTTTTPNGDSSTSSLDSGISLSLTSTGDDKMPLAVAHSDLSAGARTSRALTPATASSPSTCSTKDSFVNTSLSPAPAPAPSLSPSTSISTCLSSAPSDVDVSSSLPLLKSDLTATSGNGNMKFSLAPATITNGPPKVVTLVEHKLSSSPSPHSLNKVQMESLQKPTTADTEPFPFRHPEIPKAVRSSGLVVSHMDSVSISSPIQMQMSSTEGSLHSA